MKDFKLIAIRPTKKCDKKFLKVLKENIPCVFYKEFDFANYSDKARILEIKENKNPDLYSIKNSKKEDIKINVSAIVGENGSGKSSLVELFYAACYNLSVYKNVLIDEEKKIRLTTKDRVKNVYVEIFYKVNDTVFLLKFSDIQITFFKLENEVFVEKDSEISLDDFFYTISINYSLHALNSNVLGIWIKKIFHKNDGYQTPIVLNPYRTNGNIEINDEEYLIKSRLISNILGKIDKKKKAEESLRNVIDRKIAYRLHIELNRSKFKFDKKKKPIFELTQKYGSKILPILYKHFLSNQDFIPKQTLLNEYAQEYIIYKLISIASKYDPYKSLFRYFYQEKGDVEGYIFMLSSENSHVTFKLVQAINFLTNDLYYDRKESFDLTISYLSDKLEKLKSSVNKELIDILPPAFFNMDIEFKDADMFNQLSSGEKQRVFNISTLLYHLNNLSSTNSKIVLYKYKNVNVIFDEVELYFHPELQRTLVNDVLENIKKIDLLHIASINLLFITHSPFILSDVSSSNILVLEKDGTPKNERLNIQTFGANIFDLLKNDFFLENGPMGEFAKNKINETISWLKDEKRNLSEKDKHKEIIMMIGEPILQINLSEMFDNVTQAKTEVEIIKKRIAVLQETLEKKTK